MTRPERQVTTDPTQLAFPNHLTNERKKGCALPSNPDRPRHAYSAQDGRDDLLAAGDAPEQGAGGRPHLRAVLCLLLQLLPRLLQLLSQSQFLLQPEQNENDEQRSTSNRLVFSLAKVSFKEKCTQNYRKRLLNEN